MLWDKTEVRQFHQKVNRLNQGFKPCLIFSLRQIPVKNHEHQVDTHHIFVDHKAAFDRPKEAGYLLPC